tara:strand:- start:6720 stop:8189 length:1470 start_codon:yes stop_codon:yes gene_type:complete
MMTNKINFHKKKERQKWLLIIISSITIILSIVFNWWLINSFNTKAKDLQKKGEKIQLATEGLQNGIDSIKIAIEKLDSIEEMRINRWSFAMSFIQSVANNQNLNDPFISSPNKASLMTFDSAMTIVREEKKIPIIVVDACDDILQNKNINFPNQIQNTNLEINIDSLKNNHLKDQLDLMKKENKPFYIILPNNDTQKVYYRETKALREARNFLTQIDLLETRNQDLINTQKQIYTESSEALNNTLLFLILQIFIIILFAFIAYFIFNAARRSERNFIWAGMAKETAHQIGTPLSSLIGWVQILKEKNNALEISSEMEKDLNRLKIITDRFSKIGSKPELQKENLSEIIQNIIIYLERRFSKKIKFHHNLENTNYHTYINKILFTWVIENICKNAADAMKGVGDIIVQCEKTDSNIIIFISDTGKGIDKEIYNSIFMPGVTSKKRGWGLGLSLVKRIIEDYHNGKISVQNRSEKNKTTFCIELPININKS